MTTSRTTISARLDSAIVAALKRLCVPVSDVIAAGVLHFLQLDDFAKVKFLIQNHEEAIHPPLLVHRSQTTPTWPELVRSALSLSPAADVKAAVRELVSVAKNLDDRGEEVFLKKRIARLDSNALLHEAHHLVMKSAYAEAATLYESALRLLEEDRNRTEAGKTYCRIGQCQQALGRLSDALDYYEKARRIFEHEALRHDLAKTLYWRGTCYQAVGRYDDACNSFNEARLIFEKLGNNEEIRNTLTQMGYCLTYMGDKKRVIEIYDMFIERLQKQKKAMLTSMAEV